MNFDLFLIEFQEILKFSTKILDGCLRLCLDIIKTAGSKILILPVLVLILGYESSQMIIPSNKYSKSAQILACVKCGRTWVKVDGESRRSKSVWSRKWTIRLGWFMCVRSKPEVLPVGMFCFRFKMNFYSQRFQL